MAKAGAITLLVQDEVLVNLIPTLARQWMKKGQKAKKVSTQNLHSKKDTRAAIFGAINVITGKIHRLIASAINKETFLQSIKRINNYYIKNVPEQLICLVIDGHSAHRSILVKEWIQLQSNFFFYRLPKNSPELNPIEYFWRKMRKEVTHDRLYQDLVELKATLTRFFNRWYVKTRVFSEWLDTLIEKIWQDDNHIKQFG